MRRSGTTTAICSNCEIISHKEAQKTQKHFVIFVPFCGHLPDEPDGTIKI